MSFTFALSVFMLGATAFVIFAKKLINGLIAMSIFSMLLVVYYFLLHAPDVAITEAALGAGLSTIIFLIAIRKIKEKKSMIGLLDFFSKNNVKVLSSADSKAILSELIETALQDLSEEQQHVIEEIIRDRKQIQEINIGKGIALAHERYDELDEMYISLGILEGPVRYGKGPPVQMVLCVLLPNTKSREYLSFMARFTRFLESRQIDDFFPPNIQPAEVVEALLGAMDAFESEQG